MATLARMSIHLGLDSSSMGKGVAAANSALNGLSSSLSSMVGSWGAAIGAAALAALSIGALKAKFDAAAQSVDDLSKASERLGIAIGQMQAFRNAADLAGVGAEQFDKAVVTMLRNVAEAAGGNKGIAAAIRSLGLSVRELESMDAAGKFAALAEAIGSIDDPGRRAAVAMELFGKGGIGLTSMFAGTAEAIAAAKADMDAFGTSLSAADGKAVEAMNDAWTRVSHAISGIVQKLVVEMAPALQTSAEYFLEMLKSAAAFGVSWKDIGAIVTKTFASAHAIMRGTFGVLETITAVLNGIGAAATWAFGEATRSVAEFIQSLKPLAGLLEHVGIDVGAIKDFGAGLADGANAEFDKAAALFAEGLNDAWAGMSGEAFHEFIARADAARKAAEEAGANADARIDQFGAIGEGLESTVANFRQLSVAGMEKGSTAAQAAINQATWGKEIAKAQKPMVEVANKQLAVLKNIDKKIQPLAAAGL